MSEFKPPPPPPPTSGKNYIQLYVAGEDLVEDPKDQISFYPGQAEYLAQALCNLSNDSLLALHDLVGYTIVSRTMAHPGSTAQKLREVFAKRANWLIKKWETWKNQS